jgi:hypothetical protein
MIGLPCEIGPAGYSKLQQRQAGLAEEETGWSATCQINSNMPYSQHVDLERFREMVTDRIVNCEWIKPDVNRSKSVMSEGREGTSPRLVLHCFL